MIISTALVFAGGLALTASTATFTAPSSDRVEVMEYDLIATNKTSTFRKELNRAAEEGFRFERAMGGETSFGGNEMVAILSRGPDPDAPLYEYKILATSKTGTMQKELNRAGQDGWFFVGHTSKEAILRGQEIISILERPVESESMTQWEYKLLATTKTSTMRKELRREAEHGYQFVDMIVTENTFGGREVVSVLHRPYSVMEE